MSKKKVIVTGANGAVGYEVIRQLHKDYRIVAVDLNFNNLEKFKGLIDCYNVNICDTKALEGLFVDAGYVIHLAAKVHMLPNNENDIKEFYAVNTTATKNIFELCIKYKVEKVIFLSTIAVYGNNTDKLSELTEVKPVTDYAKSKYEAEKIGHKMVIEQNLPLYVLRPATMFGNLDRGNYKSLISLCKKGISIIPGNGHNLKPIVYIKDVVGAIKSILENDIRIGEVFIISQDNYRYIDIINDIEKTFKIKTIRIKIPIFVIDFLNKYIKINIVRKIKTLSQSIQVDNNKMLKTLKYYPEYDFSSGLEDSADYYNNR